MNKQKLKKDAKCPLPYGVPLNTLLRINSAYVVTYDSEQSPVGPSKLHESMGLNEIAISGCSKFLQHLNLIKPFGKQGKSIPTSDGIKLHRAYKHKGKTVLSDVLCNIFTKSWFWNITKKYLEINDNVTYDMIIQQLALKSDSTSDKGKRSLKQLIKYMKTAKLLKDNNGKPEINNNCKPQNLDDNVEEIAPTVDTTTDINTSSQFRNISVSLGMLINPEMSEEQTRKFIRIILDEVHNYETGVEL